MTEKTTKETPGVIALGLAIMFAYDLLAIYFIHTFFS